MSAARPSSSCTRSEQWSIDDKNSEMYSGYLRRTSTTDEGAGTFEGDDGLSGDVVDIMLEEGAQVVADGPAHRRQPHRHFPDTLDRLAREVRVHIDHVVAQLVDDLLQVGLIGDHD